MSGFLRNYVMDSLSAVCCIWQATHASAYLLGWLFRPGDRCFKILCSALLDHLQFASHDKEHIQTAICRNDSYLCDNGRSAAGGHTSLILFAVSPSIVEMSTYPFPSPMPWAIPLATSSAAAGSANIASTTSECSARVCGS